MNFTEYITFDYHHRLKCIGNRIMVFNRIRNFTTQTVDSKILSYDPSGQLLHMKAMASLLANPKVEMASADEDLIVAFDRWNYSNPNIFDTLHIVELDTVLQEKGTDVIIGLIPTDFSGNSAFAITSDSCNIFFASLYSSDSIWINSTPVASSFNGNNLLLTKINDCSVTTTNGREMPAFAISVYPNPSNGIFNINLPSDYSSGAYVQVYDLSGKIIYSEYLKDQHAILDIANYKGIYLLRISFLGYPNESYKSLIIVK